MFYSRWTSFVCFLICIGSLCFAAYLQVYLGLMPCPLCVLQRIVIAILALVFLVGSLYTPIERRTKRIHSGFIIFISAIGAIIASRHVWLTMQPPGSVPTCSPTLSYLLSNLPFSQTISVIFQGSGDCARETWRMFGLNLPEWTLLLFSLFILFGIVRYICAKKT